MDALFNSLDEDRSGMIEYAELTLTLTLTLTITLTLDEDRSGI